MIKYPGSEIGVWSVLFIFAGAYVAYSAFAIGNAVYGIVFSMLPLGCILLWLDVRPAKWLVVIYLGIAALGAVGMLFTNGFAMSSLIRAVLAGYTAYLFAV